ncbi:octopamine receptor beta-2R-like [Amphiura filiformis]|uniref:octopamine receptor beta-2R-like n=1 Tax=Amphiura filiformis TaxID=82378 RepID=UPI003B226F3D
MSTLNIFNSSVSSTNVTDASVDGGPKFSPKTSAEIFLASLKILIGIVGVLGNLTVCIVVAKMRSQKNYANSLIVSQAVTDLVTALVLIATTFTEIFPGSPPSNYAMGYLYCVFWYSRVTMFCMFSISTFNLVAISLERYIAVIHPIWYSHHFSRKVAAILATAAWLLGPLMQTILGFTELTFEAGNCKFLNRTPVAQAITGVTLFLWDFFVPCILMAFCFIQISVKFQNQKKRVGASEMSTTMTSAQTQATTITRARSDTEGRADKNDTDADATSEPAQQSRKKNNRGRNITKTLAIVFLVYVICWSPDQFLFLQWNLGGNIDFGGVLHSVVVIMAMLNSACNPFIYALRYKQYKEGLKSLFKCF